MSREVKYSDCFNCKQEDAKVTYAVELADKYLVTQLVFDQIARGTMEQWKNVPKVSSGG